MVPNIPNIAFFGGADVVAFLKKEVGSGEEVGMFSVGKSKVFISQEGAYFTRIDPCVGLPQDLWQYFDFYRITYRFTKETDQFGNLHCPRQKGVYVIDVEGVVTSGTLDYKNGDYLLTLFGKKLTDLLGLYNLVRIGAIHPIIEFDNPSGQKTAHQLAEENDRLIHDLNECAIVMDASTNEILRQIRNKNALQVEFDRVNLELANSNKKISKVRDELKQALESLKLSGRGCFRRLNHLRKAVKTALDSI